MRYTKILASLMAAGLFSACGGGGGGDSPPPVTTTPSAITLAGVVAKGALRNAVVRAHPIAADGSVNEAIVLGSGTTNNAGEYSLSFEGTAGQPYVIRVSATADTRQLDEITGQAEDVPDTFALRALFVPQTTGTISTSASVTPFSEMAVAAAARGTGGVTAANAAQASANVTALLGFNPVTVTPTTIAAAGSNTERLAFATVLTAVSKLANESGLSCAQATLAERTQCVVTTLSNNATLSSTQPGTTVSAALNTAVQAVAVDPVFTAANSNLTPTIVAVVSDNLTGSGTPPTPPPVQPTELQTAIAATKTFFDNLRSDWVSMFGRSGVNPSAMTSEGNRFEDAMRDVQAPVELLLKDSSALLTGIDLYRDYMAGRTTDSFRRRASATDFVANADTFNPGARATVNCQLYTDNTNTVAATSPGEVGSIGCEANFYMSRVQLVGSANVIRWRHGFTIVPASVGSMTDFSYSTRARQTTDNCVSGVCTQTGNVALQTNFYSGTVATTVDANAHVVGFTIAGELPGAFEDGGNTLVNERHAISLTGTRTIGAVRGDSTATVSGTLSVYAAGGTTPVGTLTLTGGTLTEIPISRTATDEAVPRGDPRAVADWGGDAATADLNLTWATPTAAFVGRLTLADNAWDASVTSHVPTRATLTGQFRNIVGGVTTEFLTGSFIATATGYPLYNSTLPKSPSNDWTLGFQFSGTVTAPSRPTVALTLSFSGLSDADEATSLSAQYRTLVNGTATQTVNLTTARPASGPVTAALEIVGAGVTVHLTDGANTGHVRLGTTTNGTEIGTISKSAREITYVDGSTASLDFGL